MAATTHRSPSLPGRPGQGRGRDQDRVPRFDLVERAVHWATALMVIGLMATGAVLYVPALSVWAGHRLGTEDSHIYLGLALFALVVLALLGRWGVNLRRDLHEMSRMTPAEMHWLRSLGRRGRSSIGKFNPGQKLNTNAVGGLLVVLFATGLIMRWGNFLPVAIRTGATFVHDVFAFALVVAVGGHIAFALTHPPALRSMLTGWVHADWLRRHAPAWSAATKPALKGPEQST